MSKLARWNSKDESKHLPIYEHKAHLVEAVKESTFLLVTGETGSGKTTQLPQFLHQAGKFCAFIANVFVIVVISTFHFFIKLHPIFCAGFCKNGKIGITQPRRLAAITVAQRVAQEMQCILGTQVGYQVRFDDCTSQVRGKDDSSYTVKNVLIMTNT